MKKIVNKLEGIWSKQYDSTAFAIDGSVEYAFDGNNNYQFHTYNALGGESSHDYSGRYAIDMFNREPLPLTGLLQYHLYARQVDVEGDGLAEGRDDIFCGTWWNQKLPQKLPQNLTQFCNGNSKSYVLLKKLYLTRSDHSWPGMDK